MWDKTKAKGDKINEKLGLYEPIQPPADSSQQRNYIQPFGISLPTAGSVFQPAAKLRDSL